MRELDDLLWPTSSRSNSIDCLGSDLERACPLHLRERAKARIVATPDRSRKNALSCNMMILRSAIQRAVLARVCLCWQVGGPQAHHHLPHFIQSVLSL